MYDVLQMSKSIEKQPKLYLPQRIAFVRHGQAMRDIGKATHDSDNNILTSQGKKQIAIVSKWIIKKSAEWGIIFDEGYYSPTPRTKQSAETLNGVCKRWVEEPLLIERSRGTEHGKGCSEKPKHSSDSSPDPLLWKPVNGESLNDVIQNKVGPYIESTKDPKSDRNVIASAHRDWIIASQIYIEGLRGNAVEQAVEDSEHNLLNGQVIIYSRVDPHNSHESDHYRWKMSVCPWADTNEDESWQEIR